MARLYSNENFPIPVVEELRRLGHDVSTIQETGKANQEYPDDGVLNLAIADNRAVLTINRKHFRNLHRQVPDHKGDHHLYFRNNSIRVMKQKLDLQIIQQAEFLRII